MEPRSRLDGSWMFNQSEDGDGDISWAEDSEDSDVDIKRVTTELSTPPQPSPRFKHKSSPKTHKSTHTPGPEFIMPSLSQQPGAPRDSTTKQSPRYTKREARPDSRVATGTTQFRSRRPAAPTSQKMFDAAIKTGDYLLDIVGSTLRTLKQPISWVLAAYAFTGLLVLVQNLLTSSISNALTPICRIPGVSLLHLPICRSPYASSDQPTISSPSKNSVDPEFDALMIVQGKFETVLEDSAAGVSLPLDMKRSETSIRDLRQVVRFSTIPSKNELLHEFDGFIETARMASYDLQKFNSHVGRAVDSVLSTARWTQRVLDDISYKTLQSTGGGFIAGLFNNKLLAPFQPLQFTESRLLDQYITHSRLISSEIEALIDEAQALLLILNNIEDRLDIIHSISLRDNIAAKSSRDEILGQLWTFVGGNRAKLGQVDNQLRLLARVGEYRKLAYAHVSGTILKLQAMGTELEELRTRVGSAELASERGFKGIPLSVHIENVKLGVERLEAQREKTREVEKGHVRRVIDKAEGDERRLLVEA